VQSGGTLALVLVGLLSVVLVIGGVVGARHIRRERGA
jgi:hypothetical protein